MKNLVTVLSVLLICLFSFQTIAQVIGVKGGLSLSDAVMKDDDGDYSDETKMIPGFHVGVILDLPLNEVFSVETGLMLDTKGTKMDESDEGMSYESKIITYYLDIPVTLKATQELQSGMKIYGNVGPYVGYGLSGKDKWEYSGEGYSESGTDDIEWGSGDDDHLKRLDFGITAGAGVVINNVIVGVSYDLGLANISSYTDYGTKIQNQVLKFSVGYWFGN